MSSPSHEQWVEFKQVGATIVVALLHHEWFDEQACSYVGKQLINLADNHQVRQVVINLCKVRRLSSHMLGEIIALQKRLEALGGHLILCELQPEIDEVFDLLRLSDVFKIYQTESEALEAFISSNGKAAAHQSDSK